MSALTWPVSGIEGDEGTLQVRRLAGEARDGVEVGVLGVVEVGIRLDGGPPVLHGRSGRPAACRRPASCRRAARSCRSRRRSGSPGSAAPIPRSRGRRMRSCPRARGPGRGSCFQRCASSCGEIALVGHAREHQVPAPLRAVRVSEGVVRGPGRLRMAARSAASATSTSARFLPEVVARRVLEAVAAPHVDLVEIRFEDLVLGVGPLEVEGDLDLLQLAGEAPLEADLPSNMLRASCCVIVLPPPRFRPVRTPKAARAMPRGSKPWCL